MPYGLSATTWGSWSETWSEYSELIFDLDILVLVLVLVERHVDGHDLRDPAGDIVDHHWVHHAHVDHDHDDDDVAGLGHDRHDAVGGLTLSSGLGAASLIVRVRPRLAGER
jgi:hypothetical protein